MASIRCANCMELRLVRVWHQPTGCILRSPSFLIPYSLKRDSIPQRVADFMHSCGMILDGEDKRHSNRIAIYAAESKECSLHRALP